MKHTTGKKEDHTGVYNFMIDLPMPLPIVFESLTAFANTCFYTGVIPGELKVTKVISIAKIAEPKSLNDYRPISISAKLMLLLEKLYYNRLQLYLEEKNILSKYQFGFRKHRNTAMTMIALTDLKKKKLGPKIVLCCYIAGFQKSVRYCTKRASASKVDESIQHL